MPRNGSGTYALPAGNPVVSGTVIQSAGWGNPTMSDIASALTQSIASDGQTTPSANLPMGNFAHTGVGSASARTMYARAAEVQDGTPTYLTTVAGTNTITATAPLSMTAYVAGQAFRFIPANSNTGAATLNINSIGARNIFNRGAALLGGELTAGVPVIVVDDGTRMHLVNAQPSSLVFLATNTASNSVDLQFVSGFNAAAYSSYVFVFDSISPVTDNAVLVCRVSNTGGPPYLSTSIYQSYRVDEIVGSAPSNNSGTATAVNLSTQIGNQADEVLSGQMLLCVNRGRIFQEFGYCNGSTVYTHSYGGAHVPATVNAVQFYMSTGNINTGSITMYGVRR